MDNRVFWYPQVSYSHSSNNNTLFYSGVSNEVPCERNYITSQAVRFSAKMRLEEDSTVFPYMEKRHSLICFTWWIGAFAIASEFSDFSLVRTCRTSWRLKCYLMRPLCRRIQNRTPSWGPLPIEYRKQQNHSLVVSLGTLDGLNNLSFEPLETNKTTPRMYKRTLGSAQVCIKAKVYTRPPWALLVFLTLFPPGSQSALWLLIRAVAWRLIQTQILLRPAIHWKVAWTSVSLFLYPLKFKFLHIPSGFSSPMETVSKSVFSIKVPSITWLQVTWASPFAWYSLDIHQLYDVWPR